MAREVLFETFYTKAPGTEKLRKSADGRLRHLLRDGWHEMERQQVTTDSVRLRFEREGVTKPLEPLRKKPEPPPKRRDRGDRRGGPGGRGGRGGGPPGGRGGGPPQGGGGPPQGGRPPPSRS